MNNNRIDYSGSFHYNVKLLYQFGYYDDTGSTHFDVRSPLEFSVKGDILTITFFPKIDDGAHIERVKEFTVGPVIGIEEPDGGWKVGIYSLAEVAEGDVIKGICASKVNAPLANCQPLALECITLSYDKGPLYSELTAKIVNINIIKTLLNSENNIDYVTLFGLYDIYG